MRCTLIVAAALLVFASCASRPRTSGAASPKFNLTDGYDVNGFFHNPSWSDSDAAALRVSPHPICEKPPLSGACNDQSLSGAGIDTAESNLWLALLHGHVAYQTCQRAAHQGFLPGHVNLGVATFDGPLAWTGFSFDGDYDFLLHPRNGGLTKASPDCIGLEFNADETLSQFDCLTPWWKQYAEMARLGQANDLLVKDNGGKAPFAIVTGLLGFDCEHGCVSELHPVYIMAIRRSGGAREQWQFFVRNWGSEGWCSLDNHGLETTRLRVLLPYDGAIGSNALMEVQSSFQLYHSRGRSIWDKIKLIFHGNASKHAAVDVVAVEGGVLVTFDLPDRRSRPVIEGELSFRWRHPATLKSFDAVACPAEREAPNVESAFRQLRANLPPDQTAGLFAVPTRLVQPSSTLSVPSHETKNERIAIAQPLSIHTSTSFDTPKQARDRRKTENLQQLCAFLGTDEQFKQREDFQMLCMQDHKH